GQGLSGRKLDSGRGSRPRVLRHLGLGPDGPALTLGAARAPRRGAVAFRLRRGHAAPAPALLGRPRRAAGGVRLALPRRPLPRPAWDAQDLLAPRACAAADGLRG